MLKAKKIVVLLVILMLILGICLQVRATNVPSLDDLLNSNSTNANLVTNTTQNEVTNMTTNTNQGIVQPNTNNQNELGDKLPQTGVTEDITVMFFIIVCCIVAIYAYKKIKEYKA